MHANRYTMPTTVRYKVLEAFHSLRPHAVDQKAAGTCMHATRSTMVCHCEVYLC